MTIKSIRQAKGLSGKTVFLRVDFNVPMKRGRVADDNRLRQTLPDIAFLLEKKCKVIIATHLGRPEGKKVLAYSTKPLAVYLSKLLQRPVKFLDGTGPKLIAAKKVIAQAKPESVIFLENLRFNKEEQANDKAFAKKLAALADIYVNDAFAVSHRADASVAAIKQFLPSYAGLLLEKEIINLHRVLAPRHPLIVVIGGEKIATKINLLKNLLPAASRILIGGALAHPFLAAENIPIGQSLIDEDSIKIARELLRHSGGKIILPVDVITCSDLKDLKKIGPKNIIKVRKIKDVGERETICDIGPETIGLFSEYLRSAKTIVWNGPMGLIEIGSFSHGTLIIARMIASRASGEAYAVVGGGETVEALALSGMGEYIDWVSTGGGAMLAFLGKEPMPGLEGLVK